LVLHKKCIARIRFLCNAHRVSLAAPAIGMHNT